MLAPTQACEWHNLWWSLRTVYVLWSCRRVWWHHRSMCGKCPFRKQWTWPTSTQYTCATDLVTSETWNNQEEKNQLVTEELFMLRLRIPSHQDTVSWTVKKRKYFIYHIGSMFWSTIVLRYSMQKAANVWMLSRARFIFPCHLSPAEYSVYSM